MPLSKTRELVRAFTRRARGFGVLKAVQDMREMFDMEWPEVSEIIRTNSTMWLKVVYPWESRYWSFAQIVPDMGLVRLRFHPWTIDLLDEDRFTSLMEKIPYERDHFSHLGDDKYSNRPSIDLMLIPIRTNVVVFPRLHARYLMLPPFVLSLSKDDIACL